MYRFFPRVGSTRFRSTGHNGVPYERIVTDPFVDIADPEEASFLREAFRGQLVERPGNPQYNLFLNPSFEYGGTGLNNNAYFTAASSGGASAGSNARVNGGFPAGIPTSGAWAAASSWNSVPSGGWGGVETAKMAVTAGLAYSWTLKLKYTWVPLLPTRTYVRWYNASGTFLSEIAGDNSLTQTALAVTEFTGTAKVAPAGAASAALAVRAYNTAGATQDSQFYFDQVSFVQSAVPIYIDGDLPWNFWDGPAGSARSFRLL